MSESTIQQKIDALIEEAKANGCVEEHEIGWYVQMAVWKKGDEMIMRMAKPMEDELKANFKLWLDLHGAKITKP